MCERFCEIVISPRAESWDFIHILGFCTEHCNRDVHVLAYSPAEFESIDAGHHDIQDHQLDAFPFQYFKLSNIESDADFPTRLVNKSWS
jgi:hypothetical protein